MTVDHDDTDARLARAVQHIRFGLAELAKLERAMPAAIARVVGLLVAHLRSWKPESVTPLGDLGPPTEAIRDPRSAP